MPTPGAPRSYGGRVGEETRPPGDEGGDAACWLQRVCPECGRMAEEDPPTTCAACGAELRPD